MNPINAVHTAAAICASLVLAGSLAVSAPTITSAQTQSQAQAQSQAQFNAELPAAGSNYTVTASALNVRSGPGTGYKVVGTLKKGAQISATISGSWAKITSGTYTGRYVSKSYLSLNSGGSTSTGSTSQATTVRNLATKYGCATSTKINLTAYQGHNGAADMWNNQIYIKPTLTGGRLNYTVAHECGHMMQARAYGGTNAGINQVIADMNRIYGGSGYNGIDRNADCITVLRGLSNQYYTTSCSGARKQAALDIMAGRRVTV